MCHNFLGGQQPSNALVTMNQLTTGGTGNQNAATVKRRKKSTATPNPKKMFEEVLFTVFYCYSIFIFLSIMVIYC